MILQVLIEDAGPNWCAGPLTDEIGLLLVTAPTREETVDRFLSALAEHLNDMAIEGLGVPDIQGVEFHETVPFRMAAAA